MELNKENKQLLDVLLNMYINNITNASEHCTRLKIESNKLNQLNKYLYNFLIKNDDMGRPYYESGFFSLRDNKDEDLNEFVKKGGFYKDYNEEEELNRDFKDIHINNFQGNTVYNEDSNKGNQSLSDNALDSPTIQKITKHKLKKPKWSLIEIIALVIGIIASIIAIYEFCKKITSLLI